MAETERKERKIKKERKIERRRRKKKREKFGVTGSRQADSTS